MSAFFQQPSSNRKSRRFASIPSVGFKGKTEEGDSLPGYGVEHTLQHDANEPVFLPFIDLDDGSPVVCYLSQAVALADIDQVQDILLEARTTEADAGF